VRADEINLKEAKTSLHATEQRRRAGRRRSYLDWPSYLSFFFWPPSMRAGRFL
jgi:hypothetical protein